MGKPNRALLAQVNDLILFGVALASIILIACSGLGWLQLSDRNLSIAILVFLITFAVSIFVERRTYLSSIQSRLDTILNNYSMGVHYLEDEKLVASELTKAVRGAEQRIRAIGAKSEIIAYLKEIESAVLRRGVSYYRLINGTHIRHTLHQHLSRLLKDSSGLVRIAWSDRNNLVSMTVTENECVIILPSTDREKYAGLRLPSQTSDTYTEHFMSTFSAGTIELHLEGQLEALCEKCSAAVDREPGKMEELLRGMGELQT